MTEFDFLTTHDAMAASGIASEADIPYLPLPNTVDVVLSDRLAPDDLTPTAFVFPFFENGDILLACNRRRKVEVPGGHRDPVDPDNPEPRRTDILEHPAVAAIREADEEAGVTLEKITAVGFMRSVTTGLRPEGYRYPYPASCQQFFAGVIADVREFVETDECKMPVRLTHEQAEDFFNDRTLELYRAARQIAFPKPEPITAPAP